MTSNKETWWHAEGTLSYASFVTSLLRTDQGILDAPSFPFDEDVLYGLFWASARLGAAVGSDKVWASNLPRGLSPETRANLFHERYHYGQILSYPLLQLNFLHEMEQLRIRISEVGGSPSVVCGETNSGELANPRDLELELGTMKSLLSGDPVCSMTAEETVEGVSDAAIVPAVFGTAERPAPGAAGILHFDDGPQLVPFNISNLLESAAKGAQHLFEGTPLPRLRTRGTKREIRYLGPWEVWYRLHSERHTSESELAMAFLAAVDLALGAHVLALFDDNLQDIIGKPRLSAQMRYPHARLGAIALHAREVAPFGSVQAVQSARGFQRVLSSGLHWPDPDRAYRFMAAFLTQRLLYSSLWSFERKVSVDREALKWAITAPLSEIADHLESLHPMWTSIAASFPGVSGEVASNVVIGSRVLAKMISASRLRSTADPLLASPHADPAVLSRQFELPVIRLGNRYYIDSDLSDSPDMEGEGVEVFDSLFKLPAIDMMTDCIALAVLEPLRKGETGCGLIDPATHEAECIYVAAGAGCPKKGVTPHQAELRSQQGVFDWCHWTYAAS